MTDLAEIIELDAAIPAENLQFSPEVYTHRRFLLEHIRQRDEDVKELGELMGLEGSLSDIIATVRQRLEAAQAEAAKLDKVEHELHSPFHETAAAPLRYTWQCFKGNSHMLGERCECHASYVVAR